MTIATNERDLITQTNDLLAQLRQTETALAVLAGERRALRRDHERELRIASKEALAIAQTDLAQKAQALAAAQREEQSLTDRLDSGDAFVTVSERQTAALAVDSAQRLHKAAQAALTAPAREYAIDSSDSLVAERAVEILSADADRLGLSDVDIVSFKRPGAYQPVILPTLVVSQTANTANVGTSRMKGSVSLKFFTADDAEAPTLDAESIAEIFDDHFCDATLNGSTLTFARCTHKVPMLANGPDVRVLAQWGSDIAGIIDDSIKKYSVDSGIRVNLDVRESWDNHGFMHFEDPIQVKSASFDVDGGNAIGHIDLQVNTESEGSHVGAALEWVAGHTKDYLLDVPTDMGLVEKVTVTVDKVPTTYTETGNYSIYGVPKRTASRPAWIVRYELHTKFEPMAAVVD